MVKGAICFVLSVSLLSSVFAYAQNVQITSFSKAKQFLLKDVYTDYFKTVYCHATYHPENKKILTYPLFFDRTIMQNRSDRIEYEHIVPAENFGGILPEWKNGHKSCQTKGKPYKGRRCAEKANHSFKLMQADMYNLYPAIGSVNGVRSNKQFVQLPRFVPSSFGTCHFKISDDKAEPPNRSKGIVARTHLYFDEVYFPQFKLSNKQTLLMIEWHLKYPVTQWECIRTYRIEQIQKSENLITKQACQKANLWPKENKQPK